MVAQPALSLLETLFSKAAFDIRVPAVGGDDAVADRDLAFYDETLSPILRLVLPVSAALPPPNSASETKFDLPISAPNGTGHDEAAGLPRILAALLSMLHVTLEGAYVQQEHGNTSLKDLPPGVLAGGTHPVPSVHRRNVAYQLCTSSGQAHQQAPQATSFHSSSWAGNSSGPVKANKKGDGSEHKERTSRGAVEYTASERPGEKGRWVVKWYCQATVGKYSVENGISQGVIDERLKLLSPLNQAYMRPRSSDPVIALTAMLSLRLSRTGICQILSLEDSVSDSFQPHDLLGQLLPSSSYGTLNDEASSTYTLSNLKLADLGGGILSTKLVTPAVNQNDMLSRLALASRLPFTLDMADDDTDVGMSTRTASDIEADLGEARRGSSAAAPMPANKFKELLTDDIRILRRNCRIVMDVRSAISVRMRTLLVPPLLQLPGNPRDNISTSDSESDSEEAEAQADLFAARDAALSHALALCVEVENVADSGLLFEIRGVNVNVSGGPSSPASERRPGETFKSDNAVARLLKSPEQQLSGEDPFPITLKQGEQHNLLYFLELSAREELMNTSNLVRGSASAYNQRSAAIVVDGRPILLTAQHDNEASDLGLTTEKLESLTQTAPTEHFLSTWNCQLDTSALDDALARRRTSALPADGPTGAAERSWTSLSSEAAGSARHRASALARIAGQALDRTRSLVYPPSTTPRLSLSVPRTDGSHSPRREFAHDGPRTPRGPPNPRQRIGSLTPSIMGSNALFSPSFSVSSLSGQNEYFGLETGRRPGGDMNSYPRTPTESAATGLLATAKMRATSLKLEADASKLLRDHAMQASRPQTPLPPSQAASQSAAVRRPLLDRLASVGTAGLSTISPQAMTPKEALPALRRGILANDNIPEVHAWTSRAFASTDPTVPASLVITTRVIAARTGHRRGKVDRAKIGSFASVPTVKRLAKFVLEVLVANRSDQEKTFVLSWPNTDGAEMARPKKGAIGVENVTKYGATQSGSAVIPEDNHLLIGPIPPSQIESAHLTVRALLAGIHDVAPRGLVLLDVETGEKARLCGVGEVVVEA